MTSHKFELSLVSVKDFLSNLAFLKYFTLGAIHK